MIDLVYPLSNLSSKYSVWDNNEIRYSIRSFETNFKDLGKIFIIGDKPDFLDWSNKRLIHIPFRDISGNKDRNIVNKVLEACQLKDLSSNFIRASDDQLVMRKVDISHFKPLYSIELFGNLTGNMWHRRLNETYFKLKQAGKERVYKYDNHYPMMYSKLGFIETIKKFPFVGEGYTINTMYFNNILYSHNKLDLEAVQLRRPVLNLRDFRAIVNENVNFLNYNNKALREGVLKQFIENTFNMKSKFEL